MIATSQRYLGSNTKSVSKERCKELISHNLFTTVVMSAKFLKVISFSFKQHFIKSFLQL